MVGIEALGGESLCQLRSQSDWPQSPQWRNGRYSTAPRKALAHAAITVLAQAVPDFPRGGLGDVVPSDCFGYRGEMVLYDTSWRPSPGPECAMGRACAQMIPSGELQGTGSR